MPDQGLIQGFAEASAGLRSSLPGNALYYFGLFLLIYLPLERLYPAHRQRVIRREWGTDLLFFLGQFLLWTAPVVTLLWLLMRGLDTVESLQPLRAWVAALPVWLQIGLLLLISDVCLYWAHRLSHQVPFLWRFHKVHHTAERLDWMAAYREHPFDNLYTRTMENLPFLLLGFPLEWLAGFFLFRGFWALYIHSNVSLTPGPLSYLLGSSRLHHWHHDLETAGRVNYANLSPLMDLLFGTYHDPGHMPRAYGIDESMHHGYLEQLTGPLLPVGRIQEDGQRGRLESWLSGSSRRRAAAADPQPEHQPGRG